MFHFSDHCFASGLILGYFHLFFIKKDDSVEVIKEIQTYMRKRKVSL